VLAQYIASIEYHNIGIVLHRIDRDNSSPNKMILHTTLVSHDVGNDSH